MGQAKRDGIRWCEAKAAAQHAPAWLAVRWLFAQAYNAHQPQGAIQEATKARARQVAGDMVAGLGGGLLALAPPGLDTDEAWAAYLAAVVPLGPSQRAGLLTWLVERNLGQGADRRRWADTTLQLRLLLTDMRRQQQAQGRAPRRRR